MTHPSIKQYKRKMDFLTEVPNTKTLAQAQREDDNESMIQNIIQDEMDEE